MSLVRSVYKILLILLLFSEAAMADRQAYIFGYGSLMLSVARTATAPDPDDVHFIPAKLQGYHRAWNLWNRKLKMRVAAAEPAEEKSINGVIYKVNEADLPKFDARENPKAYQRKAVNKSDLSFYLDQDYQWHKNLPEDTNIYIYVAIPDTTPAGFYLSTNENSTDKKIARSYLEVVLGGCAEIDENHRLNGVFVRDCKASLGIAGYEIDDDLASPKYSRHPKALKDAAREKAEMLDDFYNSNWARYLKQIRVELKN
ncbi:gamma-glutamylcyclotransferase family protein [Spongorhabdus nitratireducens]